MSSLPVWHKVYGKNPQVTSNLAVNELILNMSKNTAFNKDAFISEALTGQRSQSACALARDVNGDPLVIAWQLS